MSKVYEIVTERIIKKLEKGTVPWRQPWRNAIAVNWKTQKPYRGINCFLLEPGEYATWNQIMEAGGKVRPEEAKKFQIVVFWKWLEKEDGETGEIDRVPLLRYYKVYEINRQCEGLESRRNFGARGGLLGRCLAVLIVSINKNHNSLHVFLLLIMTKSASSQC